MRFSVATASAALVAGVSAAGAYGNGTVYTTEVVTAYTTFCPSPTTVVHNSETYTVTEVSSFPFSCTRPLVALDRRVQDCISIVNNGCFQSLS